MPWFKVDDNLAFHAKAVAAGNPAMGLWVRAGSWAAQQLTDGFVPDHMLAALGTAQQAKRLVDNRLWERVKGGYKFHEWTERQPSKGDVEAERAAARQRMKDYRAKKKGASQDTSTQVSDSRSPERTPNNSVRSGEVQDLFGNPDPTRPDPTHITTSSEVADAPSDKPRREDVERLCDRLAEHIEANGGKRPNITKGWRDAARLLLDRDGYTEQQVAWMIDWCQRDEFWHSNILSMPKLREKFDQMRMKARPATGQQGLRLAANGEPIITMTDDRR